MRGLLLPLRLGRIGRRAVAAAVLWTLLALPVTAQRRSAAPAGPATIEEWLAAVRRDEATRGDRWSVLVRDLATGRVILSHRPDERLVPASNRKLQVFAVALEKLGPDYRFRTELGLTEPWAPGRSVTGRVILRSSGDPTLQPRYLNQRNPESVLRGWIAELAGLGVRRIAGDFLIDAAAFGADQNDYPATWEAYHRDFGYAPTPSAVALNENLIHVQARPAGTVGAPGRIWLYPSAEGLRLINRTRTVGGTENGFNARFEADGRTILAGGTLGRQNPTQVLRLPIPHPLDYVADIVADALKAEGITVAGGLDILTLAPRDEPEPIVHRVGFHESTYLIELLGIMLRESDNFLAEQIWRSTAARALGRGDVASARRLEQDWYDAHGLPWIEPGYDGSGLSRQNQVAASELVAILTAIFGTPYRAYLLESLPESGRSGTLRGRSFDLPTGRVIAKTGTLARESALTGFLRDGQGRPRWVFSILANAPPGGSTGGLNLLQNQIMKVLAGRLESGQDAGGGLAFGPKVKRYRPGTKQKVAASSVTDVAVQARQAQPTLMPDPDVVGLGEPARPPAGWGETSEAGQGPPDRGTPP